MVTIKLKINATRERRERLFLLILWQVGKTRLCCELIKSWKLTTSQTSKDNAQGLCLEQLKTSIGFLQGIMESYWLYDKNLIEGQNVIYRMTKLTHTCINQGLHFKRSRDLYE